MKSYEVILLTDEDEMNDWDDAQLQDVVAKRHGEAEKLKPKTAIVSIFFLSPTSIFN